MADPSDDYEIRARIVVQDASNAGAASAERRLDAVTKHAEGVSSSISGWLTRAFAIITSGAITRGIVQINDSLDSAVNGIATLLSAQTGLDITDSLVVARDVIKGLRQDAAAGVGELSDYRNAFQTILGPGLAGGASLNQLRELTRNALTASFALRGQEGLSLGPMDIMQALTSGAHDRTTPIVAVALRSLGVEQEKFNKFDTAKKIETLNQAFAKFAPGAAVMGQGWSAQFSTLLDRLTSIVGTLTRPLFENWLERLRGINRLLERNQDHLEQVVSVWGARLVSLWDTLIDQAGTYAAIVAGVQTYRMLGGGASITAGAGQVLTAGRAGLSAAGAAVRDPFGFSSSFGTALSGAGLGGAGGTTGVLGSLQALFPALSRLAGPLAIITTLFLAVRGAISEYPATLMFLAESWAVLMQTLANVGETFGFITKEGSALNIIGAALIGTLGGIVRAVDIVLRVLGSLVVGLSVVARVLGALVKAIALSITGDFAGAQAAQKSILPILQESNAELEKLWSGAFDFRKKGDGTGTVPDVPGAPTVPKTGQTVNIGTVNIRQNLETNADPARLAVAFDDLIGRVNRYRTQPTRAVLSAPIGR